MHTDVASMCDLQAAYCVGGHWFNAAVIEHCLLKGKVVSHRPQFVSPPGIELCNFNRPCLLNSDFSPYKSL
jgi:hypothetical protein